MHFQDEDIRSYLYSNCAGNFPRSVSNTVYTIGHLINKLGQQALGKMLLHALPIVTCL